MNIHEYQAKILLTRYGIEVPAGKAIDSSTEVSRTLTEIGGNSWVIKAQVHSGGRGKAGGIKLVKSEEEAIVECKNLLGKKLITKQTGLEGQIINKLYIEVACDIQDEVYLSFVIDRNTNKIICLASSQGGVEIEEIAKQTGGEIIKKYIDPCIGFRDYHGRQLSTNLGLTKELHGSFNRICQALYKLFMEKDLNLLEINPLVITKDQSLIPLDAKMTFDDNALYRHKDITGFRDDTQSDPGEVNANKFGLSYIKLDGDIGCMVNGAGLAMATMDIIKLNGGEPANFLDVGGSATKEKITEAFKIIIADQSVKGILVNIFGGIMKCDIIARGIINAAKEVNIPVPLIIRLEGTNVDEGKNILESSGLDIVSADTLSDAAQKVVAATRGAS